MEEKNLHTEIQDELRNISPKLSDSLPKKNTKSIPQGYFHQMQDKVLSSIADEEVSQGKIISLNRKPNLRMILVAASIVGVVIMSTFLFLNKSINSNFDMASLNKDEINTYLIDHADELDDEHLSQLPSVDVAADLLEFSEDELKPVLEDYLYQIENSELN